MNVIILLFTLFSSYVTPFEQREQTPVSFFTVQPQTVLAFEQSLGIKPYISGFVSLAGAALYSTKEELLLSKGTPLNIAPDPWQECLEYHYTDMSAGVCGGIVTYIHVSPAQARLYGLKLNEVTLNPADNNVRELLGQPNLIADDGDVYIRGSEALKIYRNPVTGEWDGIDLFDANAS